MLLVLELDEQLSRFLEALPCFVEAAVPHEKHAEIERGHTSPVWRAYLEAQLDGASECFDGGRIVSNL